MFLLVCLFNISDVLLEHLYYKEQMLAYGSFRCLYYSIIEPYFNFRQENFLRAEKLQNRHIRGIQETLTNRKFLLLRL